MVVVVVTGDTGSIITPPSSSILHQSPPRRLPAANGPSREMWTRRERMNNLYLISHFLLSAIQTRLSFGSSPLLDYHPPIPPPPDHPDFLPLTPSPHSGFSSSSSCLAELTKQAYNENRSGLSLGSIMLALSR